MKWELGENSLASKAFRAQLCKRGERGRAHLLAQQQQQAEPLVNPLPVAFTRHGTFPERANVPPTSGNRQKGATRRYPSPYPARPPRPPRTVNIHFPLPRARAHSCRRRATTPHERPPQRPPPGLPHATSAPEPQEGLKPVQAAAKSPWALGASDWNSFRQQPPPPAALQCNPGPSAGRVCPCEWVSPSVRPPSPSPPRQLPWNRQSAASAEEQPPYRVPSSELSPLPPPPHLLISNHAHTSSPQEEITQGSLLLICI